MKSTREGPLGLRHLANKVGGVRRSRMEEVSEQRGEVELPPLQGDFDLVLIRWKDITAAMVDGAGGDEEGRALLAGQPAEGESGTLEFLQVGIKVRDSDDEVVLVHSFSLQPNRSEFFTFPKGVIVSEEKLGTVNIDGYGVTVA